MMKKPRSATQLVISANDAGDGRTVYRTADSRWTRDIAEARIETSQAGAEALLAICTADSAVRVVDPYLVEVVIQDGHVRPVRYRELIRVEGPTVDPLTDLLSSRDAA
ncbi:DUF2849 domain-containing protein [uncultured Alsobacter sp.]|uniref:DUF2849 domain-containing protein n=1 Tax=uncultured Alsobacter sp. TaxID=1748258 RepID=UPI0025CE13F8|nr:DUF2849 domain-containing protein [uncultured Alsobacter sp.]